MHTQHHMWLTEHTMENIVKLYSPPLPITCLIVAHPGFSQGVGMGGGRWYVQS